MKSVYAPLIWASVCILWCIGGQFWKPARRYIIAALLSAYAAFYNKDPKKRKTAMVFLSLAVMLSAGYGVDSHLKRFCFGSETIVRLCLASMISSVFVVYILLMGSALWPIPVILAMNIGAWQIRAGSLGKIGRYDILIEDLARATALSASYLICV